LTQRREIGLSTSKPPTAIDYTQPVFTELLWLLERARPDTKQVCRDRDFERTTAMPPQSKRDARRAVGT
jgi:hypothetical protein